MFTKLRALWRLAWRETRTHWVRSLVMILMVALPVLFINGEAFTSEIRSGDWRLAHDQIQGGAAAVAQLVAEEPIVQTGMGRFHLVAEQNGGEDADHRTQTDALTPQQLAQRLTSASKELAKLSPNVSWQLTTRLQVGPNQPDANGTVGAQALVNDYSQWQGLSDQQILDQKIRTYDAFGTSGKVELVAGTLPRKANEVALDTALANQIGVKVGEQVFLQLSPLDMIGNLADSAPLLGDGQTNFTYRLSGTLKSDQNLALVNSQGLSHIHALVQDFLKQQVKSETAPDLNLILQNSSFQIYSDQPITFPQVQQANQAGWKVLSRAVLEDGNTALAQGDYQEVYFFGANGYVDYGLAIFVYSILFVVFVLATAILIPVSSLFSQSMLPTGKILLSVGATRRQWRAVIVLTQLALILVGVLLGHLGALALVVALAKRIGMPLQVMDSHLGIFLLEVVAALVMALVAGVIGNLQVEKTLSQQGVLPRKPARSLFWLGLGLAVFGLVMSVVAIVSESLISSFMPLFYLLILVGAALTTPSFFHWLDSRRAKKPGKELPGKGLPGKELPGKEPEAQELQAQGPHAEGQEVSRPGRGRRFLAACLAWRDLRRRRHRTVPAIFAITIVVGGAISFGPLLGVTAGHSQLQNPVSFAPQNSVLLMPTALRANREVLTQNLDQMQTQVEKYLSVGSEIDLEGAATAEINQANLPLVANPAKWDVPAAQVTQKLAPGPTAAPTGNTVGADNSPWQVSLGARNPQGTYPGCPGINPHQVFLNYSSVQEIQQYTGILEQSDTPCAELLKRAKFEGSTWEGFSEKQLMVDDGTLMQLVNQSLPSQYRVSTAQIKQVLDAGGVVVNDPDLVADGKTTVVLALVPKENHNAIPDPAFPAAAEGEGAQVLRSVTVPALYLPLPFGKMDQVVMGKEQAKQFGLSWYPVGRILLPKNSANWFKAYAMESELDQVYGPQHVTVNQPNIEGFQEYLVYVAGFAAVICFIVLLLVVLTSLEVQPVLRVLHQVGAPPGLGRRFGAWYGALTVGVGLVIGLVAGIVVNLVNVVAYQLMQSDQGQLTANLTATTWGAALMILSVIWLPLPAAALGAWLLPRKTTSNT